MINENFVIIGAVVNLWGSIIYARDTIRGTTKPNRVTWGLWSLAPLIAFAAEINKGIGVISAMTFVVGFGPLIVFTASFVNKKSYWKLKVTDYACGVLSLAGLALWLAYDNGNIAIIFSVFADALAAAPTIVKSFNHPETESGIAYSVTVFSAIVTLLAIKHWTVANYAFPIYILIINIVFVGLIQFKLGAKLRRQPAGNT